MVTFPSHPEAAATSRGGGTGITAAILALLGGLFHLIGVAGGAVMLAGDDDLARGLLTFATHLVLAAALLTGGVGLILPREFGRAATIAGSAAALTVYLLVLVLGAFGVYFLGLVDGDVPLVYVAVLCVPAAGTLVLASLPPTGRWVARGWS